MHYFISNTDDRSTGQVRTGYAWKEVQQHLSGASFLVQIHDDSTTSSTSKKLGSRTGTTSFGQDGGVEGLR